MEPVEEALCKAFIPAIFGLRGMEVSDSNRRLYVNSIKGEW